MSSTDQDMSSIGGEFPRLCAIRTSTALKRGLEAEIKRTGDSASDIIRRLIHTSMRNHGTAAEIKKRLPMVEPTERISVRLTPAQYAFLSDTAKAVGVPISTVADMLIGDHLFGRKKTVVSAEAPDETGLFD